MFTNSVTFQGQQSDLIVTFVWLFCTLTDSMGFDGKDSVEVNYLALDVNYILFTFM